MPKKKPTTTPPQYQRATGKNVVSRPGDFAKWSDRLCSVCFQRATKLDKRGHPYCSDHCPE